MGKYRQNYKEDSWTKFGVSMFVVYAIIMLLVYFTDRVKFWHWFIYTIIVLVVVIAAEILLGNIIKKHKQKHLNKLIEKTRSSGQEEYIKNFIIRFGLESGRVKGWSFRKHNFDWDRINDLKKILKEKNITSNKKDTFTILKHYIQEKEEEYTKESINKRPQKFNDLSRDGSDFEKLLYRLFEAMGYKVELIGRSGDQGGDLIANKNGERILIQAKCYRDWSSTGNEAVQQVVGAMKFYDCNKTMVFTTSHFTQEAISLAKSTQTELVSKEQLQEMLLKYLSENWY